MTTSREQSYRALIWQNVTWFRDHTDSVPEVIIKAFVVDEAGLNLEDVLRRIETEFGLSARYDGLRDAVIVRRPH